MLGLPVVRAGRDRRPPFLSPAIAGPGHRAADRGLQAPLPAWGDPLGGGACAAPPWPPPPARGVFLSDDGPSSRREAVSHRSLGFHFPDGEWYHDVRLFGCLWKTPIRFLCSFLNPVIWGLWLLNCVSSLYILNVSLLSDAWFANIFFHFVGGLFLLSTVSLYRS